METHSPSMQRNILRLIQLHGPIERSELGRQSRSYDPDNWEAALDDLIDRGLITEGSQIRVGLKSRRRQKRAVITYVLSETPGNWTMHTVDDGIVMEYPDGRVSRGPYPWPKFADMSPEEVQVFIQRFSPRAVAS